MPSTQLYHRFTKYQILAEIQLKLYTRIMLLVTYIILCYSHTKRCGMINVNLGAHQNNFSSSSLGLTESRKNFSWFGTICSTSFSPVSNYIIMIITII